MPKTIGQALYVSFLNLKTVLLLLKESSEYPESLPEFLLGKLGLFFDLITRKTTDILGCAICMKITLLQ